MEITKIKEKETRTSDLVKPKYEGVMVDEKGDLVYEKKHQHWMYKIIKYNPIDPLNDLYHWVVDQFHLGEKEAELQWWAAYIYVKWVMRTLWRFKTENVSGALFPEYGPGILVGNHQSHLDPFFYGGATHRRIQYMSKDENFKTPIVKTLFRNLGAFSLGERDNPEDIQRAKDKAKQIIRNGQWVGIFPEATRSKDGTIGEFKTGAVRLAIEEQVPIVPVAVIGSRDALPKGKLIGKPVQVTVRVGAPIRYEEYRMDTVSPQDILRLTNDLRDVVISLYEGTYVSEEEKKKQELSIGSPQDAEKKPRSKGFISYVKRFAMDFLWLWDDAWYSTLRSLQAFDTMKHFQSAIYNLSGNFVHNFSNLMNPYRMLDYDKYIPKVQETGAIICSNHNSEWDVLILATSFQQMGHIVYQQAKESLFKIPVVNAWVRTCHAFPLKRGGHDVGSYNFAKQLLENNKWVIIYPEGTTNSGGGELLEGHTGPIRLAIDAQVPIYLVGITGTEKVYPKHAKMLNFGQGVILKAGPPFMEHLKHKNVPEYDELKRLTDKMMAQIKDLLMYDNPEI